MTYTQKWKKLGNIFIPSGNVSWMKTHAANPVVRCIDNDIFQIFFSGRDDCNRASIGFIVIDINSPNVILNLSAEPVISPGSLGGFDDSGTSVACIVPCNNKIYLYYLGWNLGVTVPWRNSIGLAISDDGYRFKKYSSAPILDRSTVDPFSISYPYILREDKIWKMWYGSNLKWGKSQKDMMHVIKYASSNNGIDWTPSGVISIDVEDVNEYAFSKPSVIKKDNKYLMWYSFRGEHYKIGYAESSDGIIFNRKDRDTGINISNSGWDSEMIEYPNVVYHKGKLYMFYNGNNYGKSGIGLAVLDEY